jgi:hypothetical protein
MIYIVATIRFAPLKVSPTAIEIRSDGMVEKP